MEYTKNYHLPQWKEDDRIMMRDFNDAMAGIEEGFNQGDKSEQELWRGVLRTAAGFLTREFHDLREELVSTAGMLMNPLSDEGMAEKLTGANFDLSRHVYIGRGPAVEQTALRQVCTGFKTGYTDDVYIDNTAEYAFVSPLDGTIKSFELRYYLFFYEGKESFTGGKLTFKAFKKAEGSEMLVYEKTDIPFEMHGTDSVKGGIPVIVDVPLEKGAAYHFTLHLDSGKGIMGRFGFTADMNGSQDVDDSVFSIIRRPVTTGRHNRNISLSEESTHAVALIQYRQEQSGGGISAAVDSAQLTEVNRRTVIAADGELAQEVTLTGEGRFHDTAEWSVTLACGEADELQLISYAVLLL